jgi:hypothetical protein
MLKDAFFTSFSLIAAQGTLGSVSYLIATTLNDRKCKLWNIISTEKLYNLSIHVHVRTCIPVLLEYCCKYGMLTIGILLQNDS